ncbi:hypothetical protein [uncultured Alistipes sp.]|uniref:hypothetical protein n=1 Tax=uncultured Alistipes sp. TaxID=538949 RepID=UPI002616F4CE|nr:hypothetical protein [uncultured Alistipes sp.]
MMKHLFARAAVALLVVWLAVSCSEEEEDGNAIPFVPDPALRDLLLESFDSDGDGVLSDEEFFGVIRVRCSPRRIASLEGLGCFPNLMQLYCERNDVASLRFVSEENNYRSLSALQVLDNPLNEVRLSGLSLLETVELRSSRNMASGEERDEPSCLRIEHCRFLERLSIRSFLAATLELVDCPDLRYLRLHSVRMSELDFSSLHPLTDSSLSELSCDSCDLSSLDVKRLFRLRTLSCRHNRLRELDASRCEVLHTLDCRFNPELEVLYLSRNQRWIEDIRKDAHTQIRYVEDDAEATGY